MVQVYHDSHENPTELSVYLVFCFCFVYIDYKDMPMTLSPYKQSKARELFNIFNVFNSISWMFLTGNVITLFVLRMGASSTFIGFLTSLVYVAFFFLPLGRILASRFSLVKIFSIAWCCRSLGMLPLLFAPLLYSSGRPEAAFLLVIIGVSLFHIIRGIGMISNNPILSFLTAGPDRGSYMTQLQVANSAVAMFCGFIIAMLLGRDPPFFLYIIILTSGIGFGIFGSILLSKMPEPEREEGIKSEKITTVIREAFAQPSIKSFVSILVMVSLVSGVSRTFIVVYSREVFALTDGMVSLFSVFGSLGYLLVGLFIKFLVDRIGAKPLFVLCMIVGLVGMVPILFFTTTMSENFTTLILFLAFLFFMLNFGWLGTEGIMQTYFLSLVPSEKMMDMGIIYFFGFGIAGAVSSLLSGMLLDTATSILGSPIISFRILYSILIVISGAALFRMRKLVSLGALPFMGALEVMFSYRDLRAIMLLEKLDKTSDSSKEAALLGALQEAPSKLSTKGLLAKVNSPRLSVRTESIRAIDALETLDEKAEKALMNDIINNPYTTAYISARALGNHGVFEAIPLLRELAVSGDYMLAGEAIIALAKLGDDAFRPKIEEIVAETENPRLKIMGVEAFGIYGSPDSVSILIGLLRESNPPPYLRDAVVLAIASILDLQNKFYPHLVLFNGDESLAHTLALDEAESAYEHYLSVHGRKRGKKPKNIAALEQQAKAFMPAVNNYVKHSKGHDLSRWIHEIPDDQINAIVQSVLAEVILDEEFEKHEYLRLLIVHWASHQLRLWAKRLKNEI